MAPDSEHTKLAQIDWDTWKAKDPATLVYIVKDDHVLLIRKKRGLGAGKINAPGGRLDEGETILECAVREVQEELLIEPLHLEYLGENLFQFVDGYSLHAHVFGSSDYIGEPTETEEAIPLWFHKDELPYDEMWEDDRLWVPLILSRTRFRARYIFDGDRMIDYELQTL
jgi:8-oxo-dGTP diphosphatase